jgi:hypothetical protein
VGYWDRGYDWCSGSVAEVDGARNYQTLLEECEPHAHSSHSNHFEPVYMSRDTEISNSNVFYGGRVSDNMASRSLGLVFRLMTTIKYPLLYVSSYFCLLIGSVRLCHEGDMVSFCV